MAMDGLPEGVSPSGRVPEQLLQAAPDLGTTAAAEKRGVRENQIRIRGFYPEG